MGGEVGHHTLPRLRPHLLVSSLCVRQRTSAYVNTRHHTLPRLRAHALVGSIMLRHACCHAAEEKGTKKFFFLKKKSCLKGCWVWAGMRLGDAGEVEVARWRGRRGVWGGRRLCLEECFRSHTHLLHLLVHLRAHALVSTCERMP